MKKLLVCLSIITLFLFLMAPVTYAQPLSHSRLHVDLVILQDGSIQVREEFTVTSESAQGLTRVLPIWYKTGDDLDIVVDYRDVEVLQDGLPLAVVTRYSWEGLHIAWEGEAGEHRYTVQYTSLRQVEFLEENEVLHWNLTGRHWQIPLGRVTGSVSFPGQSFTRADGYKELSLKQAANALEFVALDPIAPGQSLWLSVYWPQGTLVGESGGERILQFDSQVRVNPDRTLEVTETITVLALGNNIRRGIERDFPTTYRDPLSKQITRVGFKVTSVMRNGSPEPYSLERLSNGTRIRIGAANVFLEHGVHTYTITYFTDRQLGFYPDHDELAWNVNGTGWELAADQITCTISLPPEIPRGSLMLSGFTGRQGALGQDWLGFVDDKGDVVFASTKQMSRYNNLTVAVGWEKGYILAPGPRVMVSYWIRDNASSAVALGVLVLTALYYVTAFLIRGRQPRRGTIIPRFLPPSGFSPAAVRYLSRFSYDQKCMTATLINMAVRGYHRICQGGARSYSLERTEAANVVLAPEEASVGRALFRNQTSIKLAQVNYLSFQTAGTRLAGELQAYYGQFFRALRSWSYVGAPVSLLLLSASGIFYPPEELGLVFVYVLGYALWTAFVLLLSIYTVQRWQERPGLRAVLVSLLTLGLLALTCLLGYWVAQDATWLLTASIFGVVVLNIFCYYRLPVYIDQGQKLAEEIEGFRLYLRVAEKDRLNVLNPPEATPQLFEQYLPYALALGVEQHWARQFNEVFARLRAETGTNYVPRWYVGDRWRLRNPVALAGIVGSSFANSVASASTAPGSSSSSGGSFSGGGSSGGGGGGGGGRGW